MAKRKPAQQFVVRFMTGTSGPTKQPVPRSQFDRHRILLMAYHLPDSVAHYSRILYIVVHLFTPFDRAQPSSLLCSKGASGEALPAFGNVEGVWRIAPPGDRR